MKEIVLGVFVLLSTFLYACGIEMVQEYDQENNSEKFTFKICNNISKSVEAERIFYIGEFDLDLDGSKEKVIKVNNGTQFTLHIVSNKKPYITTIPLNDTEYVYIKDIDSDGMYEIVSYDSCYSMIFGLCRACSPAIKYGAHYKDGRLVLQPKLMKDVAPKLHTVPLVLNDYGSLNVDEMRGDIYKYAQVIEAIISFFYRGEKQKAVEAMAKYIPFQSRSMKVLFLQRLVDAMSHSYFWEQIKMLNNWEEYQDFEIVSELFEEIEKR